MCNGTRHFKIMYLIPTRPINTTGVRTTTQKCQTTENTAKEKVLDCIVVQKWKYKREEDTHTETGITRIQDLVKKGQGIRF